MKDIPVFTTEYGVASLFLREIPYRSRAHIKIQSSQEPEKLLEECISFAECAAQNGSMRRDMSISNSIL